VKAVLLTNHGGPEMLRYGEAPDPTAGPGEVVVDVYASSVNAADSEVRQGGGRYTLNQFPHILGRDFFRRRQYTWGACHRVRRGR
jgi:NADPH:quinone reductase-like Zn-dependent oxidoreductase